MKYKSGREYYMASIVKVCMKYGCFKTDL